MNVPGEREDSPGMLRADISEHEVQQHAFPAAVLTLDHVQAVLF